MPDNVDTLKVSKVSDGNIAIAPGLAFFEDGSTIRISEAHTMSYIKGVKNYVYLKQDLKEQNRNYPVCSVAGPEGDYVLLAEISEYGAITDKRTYARGKVPGYQSNANGTVVIEKEIVIDEKAQGETGIDMGTNNYSYVFVVVNWGASDKGQIGVYSLTDRTYFCARIFGSGAHNQISTECMLIGSDGGTPVGKLTFSPNGNVLNCVFKWDSRDAHHLMERRYPFTMVLC